MATTTLQHPSHEHPLVPLEFSNDFIAPRCHLCHRKISADGYTCQECEFYVHGVCAEAPSQIDRHPLHPDTLTWFSTRHDLVREDNCVICKASVEGDGYVCLHRRCECIVHNACIEDLRYDKWGLKGDSQGKTLEHSDILQFHPRQLTPFSARNNFVRVGDCVICNKASVEGDGYACSHWKCEFIIHKRCIQDLYYADGTKGPQIYHGHPLKTFLGEDTGSSRCEKCRSDESSGEFIGCAECEVFIHRDCIQVPEIIQYPHHRDHNLVLFVNYPDNDKLICDSCSYYLKSKLCYCCPTCDFFVDVGCALKVLAYHEEGMSAEIKLSWHEHPLFLCHRHENDWDCCSYCEDKSGGPMYACKEKGSEFQLHKRCIDIKLTITHPHHPDHPLTLRSGADYHTCEACSEVIRRLNFSCELCAFYLHAKCVAHVPTRKHYLHEHELLHLNKASFWDCNRCGKSTFSPFFRCVPCDLNLHVECMELPPQVVNNKVHWHPLTLHESYVEDDSGEYYCDQCENRRDGRLGVYVCGQCTARWAYHIECVLPELRKVCVERNAAAIMQKRLMGEITRREEQVCEVERKLDEMKRELNEVRKKHAALSLE